MLSFIINSLGRFGATRLLVTVPVDQETRLRKTCFRIKEGPGLQPNLPLAGNFRKAWCFARVYRLVSTEFDKMVIETIEEHLQTDGEAAKRLPFTESLQIAASDFVGWSSTAPLDSFHPEDIEEFQPNKRSYGLRVKLSAGINAPLTEFLTIIASFHYSSQDDEWRVVVQSVYPGKDVGELAGNVSKREGVAFFSFENPGESPDSA
jgi:hypothetical protein